MKELGKPQGKPARKTLNVQMQRKISFSIWRPWQCEMAASGKDYVIEGQKDGSANLGLVSPVNGILLCAPAGAGDVSTPTMSLGHQHQPLWREFCLDDSRPLYLALRLVGVFVCTAVRVQTPQFIGRTVDNVNYTIESLLIIFSWKSKSFFFIPCSLEGSYELHG